MSLISPDNTSANSLELSDDQTVPRDPVIPDEFQNSGSLNLKHLYSQIASLCKPDEQEGDPPPTERAVAETFKILEQTGYRMMPSESGFPMGQVTTDYQGGLRIEWWHHRSHCVTLVVDALDGSKDYVFLKLDDGLGTINRRIFPQRFCENLKIIARLQSNNGE